MNFPKYVSHKTVEGFKIGSIRAQARGTHANDVEEPMLFRGQRCAQHTEYVVISVCGKYTVVINDDFVFKHSPYVGGYYVRYEDGYTSFSPADAFEGGYTQLEASE